MNKKELIESVASKAELTKKDANSVVDAVTKTIQEALVKGEKVRLTGFGTFEVHNRAARKGRNIKTGEEIEIPEKKAVVFKSGKPLKESVQ